MSYVLRVLEVLLESDDMFAAARKAKTVDEFVGGHQAIYHGTSYKFSKFSHSKTPGGTAWFSDNKDAVQSNRVEGSRRLGQPWNVMTRYLKPNVKLVDRNTPEGRKLHDDKVQDQLHSMGYRGIKYEHDPERGNDIELFHPNHDTYTHAQLTSFYNKAKQSGANS